MSNPPPYIHTWTDNNENVVNLEGRFQEVFTDVVQLIIANVTYADNGTWVFGAINIIGNVSMGVILKIAGSIICIANCSDTHHLFFLQYHLELLLFQLMLVSLTLMLH